MDSEVIERLRTIIWDTNKYLDQTYADLIGSLSNEALAARYVDTLSPRLAEALVILTDCLSKNDSLNDRLKAAENEISRLEWVISLHPIDPSVISLKDIEK